jgi:hypothetical protein
MYLQTVVGAVLKVQLPPPGLLVLAALEVPGQPVISSSKAGTASTVIPMGVRSLTLPPGVIPN